MNATEQNNKNTICGRESGFDLLRFVSIIFVVFLHTVKDVSNTAYSSFFFNNSFLYSYLLNFIGAFAVPCFFMLSGAFVLDNYKNGNISFFYSKIFKKIIIPTFIFTLIYFFYNEIPLHIKLYEGKINYFSLLNPVKELLRGSANGHLWYITVLIGIYLFIPFIVIVKERLNEKSFSKFCWLYFIIAMISGFSSSFYFHWSVGKIACFLGYVLAGYQIRNRYKESKNNIIAVLLLILGLMFILASGYIQYFKDYSCLIKDGFFKSPYSSADNFTPTVIIGSLHMFTSFSKLKLGDNSISIGIINEISQNTLYIYLIYRPFCEWIPWILFKYYKLKMDFTFYSIITTVVICAVSVMLTRFYKAMYKLLFNNQI